MILEEIRQAFTPGTYRSMVDKSGLSYTRVYGIRNGKPFILDKGLVKAIENLGYEIVLRKIDKTEKVASLGLSQLHPIKPHKKVDLDKRMALCKKLGINYRDLQVADTLVRVNGNGTL